MPNLREIDAFKESSLAGLSTDVPMCRKITKNNNREVVIIYIMYDVYDV